MSHIHIHDAEKGIVEAIILMAASCVCVPLAMALPGGNPVLGFLIAGAVIGPYALGWTGDVHAVRGSPCCCHAFLCLSASAGSHLCAMLVVPGCG
jgi:hypothetical protein